MSIPELLDKIRNTENCKVYDSCGLPKLNEKDKLPDDLKLFYEKCGGISLFSDSFYGFTILGPQEIKLANPIIVGELCEDDISSRWYILCKSTQNNYITIDLSEERLGRCYDSFWDRHGVVGECTIVARNFTEFLTLLFNNHGKSLYWLDDDFTYIGDAYDEV